MPQTAGHHPTPRAQVTATLPFQVLSALIFTFTVYGMAGLRPGINYIVKNGIVCSLMYLVAVQVRGPAQCAGADAAAAVFCTAFGAAPTP